MKFSSHPSNQSRTIADNRRTVCRMTEKSDLSQQKVAKLRPLPLPAWLALAAFPEPPGTPFALRRAMFFGREKKEISGMRARQCGERNIPRDRRSH